MCRSNRLSNNLLFQRSRQPRRYPSSSLFTAEFQKRRNALDGSIEVATISVRTRAMFRRSAIATIGGMYKVELGIGILPENLCRARIIFLARNLESRCAFSFTAAIRVRSRKGTSKLLGTYKESHFRRLQSEHDEVLLFLYGPVTRNTSQAHRPIWVR